MTEHIKEQLSAFFDDELSEEECEFLVRRMDKDPEFHQKALSYATIGAALRGEILNPDPDVLRRRVQTELGVVSVPYPKVSNPKQGTPVAVLRYAFGAVVSVIVAIFSLFALNYLNDPGLSGNSGLIAADLSIVTACDQANFAVPQAVSTGVQQSAESSLPCTTVNSISDR